jgi:leucyl-tRNA synthetase
MPVDWYNGGFEHTTLHLLYSRFIYKFLFDIGVAPQPEPYKKRTSHGIVLAEDGRKMSKSFGNVVNPDEIVKEFGADSLRLYEMFMGPFDQAIFWSTNGLKGCRRFLDRIWDYMFDPAKGCFCKKIEKYEAIFDQEIFDKWVSGEHKPGTPLEIKILLNKTIKKVSEDIENIRFNTAISQLMILRNSFYKEDTIENNLSAISGKLIDKIDFEKFLILLSPFAPHIAEELWEKLGHKESIFLEKWPSYDLNLISEQRIQLVIQVNGKIRDTIKTESDITEDKARELAISSKKIENWIAGKEIKKVIFVKGKLINIVV